MQRKVRQILCAVIVISVACGCKARSINSDESEIKWGHLSDDMLKPQSPHFLINKKRQDSFRVCLAKYMVDSHPGIDQEVQAAINIWSTYLGRNIPVKTDVKDLPRAKKTDTETTLSKTYFDVCGKGYDVVVGFGPLEGNTVGLTGVTLMVVTESDGSKRIVSFNRFLFLRDLNVSPFSVEGTESSWQSFSQKTGASASSAQLIAMMQSRNVRFYDTDNKLLTLPTLAHEFGHVWGLCDQYEGSENCDPVHSTSHLVLDSIMGGAQFRQIVYLTDDDIAGIRSLEARPGFKQDWPDTKALTDAPAPINIPALEFFNIKRLSRADGKLTINYGVLTHVPTKLTFSLLPTDGSGELSLNGEMISPDTGYEKPSVDLNIGMPKNDTRTYNVRAAVSFKDKSGTWVRQKEILTSDPR